jgi:hypothetical protein
LDFLFTLDLLLIKSPPSNWPKGIGFPFPFTAQCQHKLHFDPLPSPWALDFRFSIYFGFASHQIGHW